MTAVHNDFSASILEEVKDSNEHFIVISVILSIIVFVWLKKTFNINADFIKLTFSFKLDWKLLYSKLKNFNCIAMICCLCWAMVTSIYIYIYIYIYTQLALLYSLYLTVLHYLGLYSLIYVIWIWALHDDRLASIILPHFSLWFISLCLFYDWLSCRLMLVWCVLHVAIFVLVHWWWMTMWQPVHMHILLFIYWQRNYLFSLNRESVKAWWSVQPLALRIFH